MKKMLCCLSLSIILFISCKKDNDKSKEISVVGSWHLYSFGSLILPQTPSDSIVLTFEASGKYNQTTNAGLSEKGSYSLNLQQIVLLNKFL